MKKTIINTALAACMIFLFSLTVGCTNNNDSPLDPSSPVVITMWHSYNSYAKTIFDSLVLEFNETVGVEKGIVIDSYTYGDSAALESALYDSANNIIGSEPMPNIFTAYPGSAYRIDKLAPLVDLNKYFSKDDMLKYRSEFLKEGIWDASNAPKMIPVAKSSEVLFLNKTDWDKFANDMGISIDMLSTWEGIFHASEKYYEWSDGKAMFGMNPFSNFMGVTSAQLGSPAYTIKDNTILFSYSLETAQKIWDIAYVPHINGTYRSESYCTDGIKSGNLIAYTGSSAGAAFFPTEVIIDSTKNYPIESLVLPYPTFEDGESYIGQRGANMCISTSDLTHEYASSEFLKWFTSEKQNIEFTVSTGYIPVQIDALSSTDELLKLNDTLSKNKTINKALSTVLSSMKNHKFYAPQPFDNYYEINNIFDNYIFKKINADLKQLDIRTKNGESRETVIKELTSERAFNFFYDSMIQEISNITK